MSWSSRYLRRLLGRNPGRSLLSLLLAALLAFAFGLVTVLRGMYAELYQQVEVKPVFTGLSYERAQRVANSGYVRDPYYEYAAPGVMIEMDEGGNTAFIVNRLDELVRDPVLWDEGWDEASFFEAKRAVCIMNAVYAEKLGVKLGDKLRINEKNWLANLSLGGDPFLPGATVLELRDRRRPYVTVVGFVQSEWEDHLFFVPTSAHTSLSCLYTEKTSFLCLDIARYTLNDYHQAAEFAEYARGAGDGQRGQTGQTGFSMDTSYADRIYEMHRLLETLFPLTLAAALLLGGILPGLTVLHASREISILRALGVKVRKCVGIYTLAQALCALAGLVLGMVLVCLLQRPELSAVARPFALYLVAHLAACALGSGVFAWLCARKHVLAQLQAKE